MQTPVITNFLLSMVVQVMLWLATVDAHPINVSGERLKEQGLGFNVRRDATSPQTKQQEANSGLSTPQIAGIVAGALILILGASIAVFYFLCRRKDAAAAGAGAKEDIENSLRRGKSLEFLTLNLEASSNPWNFSPVNTVMSTQLPANNKGSKQVPSSSPQLPPFQTENNDSVEKEGGELSIPGAPIIPASTLNAAVLDTPASPKPVVHTRKSTISQVVRRTLTSIVTHSPNAENPSNKDHTETNGTFGSRDTPSPWAWGNSVNGRDSVTPIDYISAPGVDPVLMIKEFDIDDLVGVAITKRESKVQLGLTTSGIPPPPNPPPTSALPAIPEPTAMVMPPQPQARPIPRLRKRMLPTMTIPVPSATATATANLATFTLFHQSICRASTVYNSEVEGSNSPISLSPASSTRYTYCEGMSPTSPASFFCGTNHSSCVWSCSSIPGTPHSSRHTMSLYSVPSTPHRPSMLASSYSSSGDCTSSASEAPPLPTTPLPASVTKGLRMRPGPLNLRKKKPRLDHLAGEMAELPPSPRRLPEEIERVTREMRERQQDEVLRRLFGDVAAVNPTVPYGNAAQAKSPSITKPSGASPSVYGGNWPDRI